MIVIGEVLWTESSNFSQLKTELWNVGRLEHRFQFQATNANFDRCLGNSHSDIFLGFLRRLILRLKAAPRELWSEKYPAFFYATESLEWKIFVWQNKAQMRHSFF